MGGGVTVGGVEASLRRGFRFWRIWRDGTRPIGAALRRVTVQALTSCEPLQVSDSSLNGSYVHCLKHWQSLDILADNGAMHIARAYTRGLAIGVAYGKRSTHLAPADRAVQTGRQGLLWRSRLSRSEALGSTIAGRLMV